MAHGKVNGNNIVRLPSKQLKSLTDEELMLAYQCAGALMDIRIPAGVSYSDSGVIYDGNDNSVGRYIAIVWLNVKGEAVITKVMSDLNTHFTLEKVQILANGISEQFRQHLQSMPQAPQEPANDESRG